MSWTFERLAGPYTLPDVQLGPFFAGTSASPVDMADASP
jgi:hypothetical protein